VHQRKAEGCFRVTALMAFREALKSLLSCAVLQKFLAGFPKILVVHSNDSFQIV
jgi:hypothetical protein